MTRIIDFSGRDVVRTVTVGELLARRNQPIPIAQVTASSAEEAAAAELAGIEMAVCLASAVKEVREGSQKLFVTAAIDFSGAITEDQLLGSAYKALHAGADAVITARRPGAVRRLADEDIPVMGHLGFVPKNSTWYGGVRAVGRTAKEAIALWDKFRYLEDAGAFGVECELIPADVMHEINKRTELVTVSLGSGPDADIMFLFAADICGESHRLPRHARKYGKIGELRQQLEDERVRAMKAYRTDVATKCFPGKDESVSIESSELVRFCDALAKQEQ